MKLFHPTHPYFINQKFGGNAEYYSKHVPGLMGHSGIDLMATRGQPIYASHDGLAILGVDDKEGYGVVIRSNEKLKYKDSETFIKTIYWHLLPEGRRSGQVKQGEIIGYADNTGLSMGDHLHFALKPQAQNEDDDSWFNIEQKNGYFGNIDPEPHLDFYFYRDLKKGANSIDVFYLQKRLGVTPTWYYGPKTQAAVFDFQIKNLTLSWYERYILKGSIVGPKTRKALNA